MAEKQMDTQIKQSKAMNAVKIQIHFPPKIYVHLKGYKKK